MERSSPQERKPAPKHETWIPLTAKMCMERMWPRVPRHTGDSFGVCRKSSEQNQGHNAGASRQTPGNTAHEGRCRPRPGPDKHADKPELRKLGLSLKVKVHSAGPRQGLRKAYPSAQPNSIRYSAPKIELKSASVSGAFRSLPPGRPWARHFGDTHLTSHLPQALKADSVPGQVRARGVDGGEGHRSLNCLASASSSVTGGSISSSRTEGGDVRQGPSST